MSFGDLRSPPVEAELSNLLTPLSLNNKALKQATAALRNATSPSESDLLRVNDLRERNREIALRAVELVNQSDADRINPEVHSRLAALLEEFKTVVRDSKAAEENARARMRQQLDTRSYTDAGILPVSRLASNEDDPLIPRPASVPSHVSPQNVLIPGTDDPLLRERRDQMHNIRNAVEDVNAIFLDLASMIGDQRSNVELVEDTSADAAERINSATRQLERASARRESRKHFFFCSLISLASIIAVFLIFLLR